MTVKFQGQQFRIEYRGTEYRHDPKLGWVKSTVERVKLVHPEHPELNFWVDASALRGPARLGV
jgi:hypothetical protein